MNNANFITPTEAYIFKDNMVGKEEVIKRINQLPPEVNRWSLKLINEGIRIKALIFISKENHTRKIIFMIWKLLLEN